MGIFDPDEYVDPLEYWKTKLERENLFLKEALRMVSKLALIYHAQINSVDHRNPSKEDVEELMNAAIKKVEKLWNECQ